MADSKQSTFIENIKVKYFWTAVKLKYGISFQRNDSMLTLALFSCQLINEDGTEGRVGFREGSFSRAVTGTGTRCAVGLTGR